MSTDRERAREITALYEDMGALSRECGMTEAVTAALAAVRAEEREECAVIADLEALSRRNAVRDFDRMGRSSDAAFSEQQQRNAEIIAEQIRGRPE